MADEATEENIDYVKIEDLQQGLPNENCVNIFADEDGTVKRSTLGTTVEALSVKKEDYKADKKALQDQIDSITDGSVTVPNASHAQSASTAYKASGDWDGNNISETYLKKEADSQTVTGNLNVAGNFSVEGESYETHLEKVYTKNDLIKTRDGAVAGLSENEVTGIEAEKYDGTHNGQLVFDRDGTARVGDVGDTQPLATREEESNMTSGSFVAWEATSKKLITPAVQPTVISDTETVTNKGNSSSFIRNMVKGYINNSSATTISRSVTMANFTPTAGDIVKVLFTTECYSTSSTAVFKFKAGTQSSYYNVKVCKDGALIDLPTYRLSADSTNKYRFFQAYTQLDLMWDGSNWIVDGNPIVASGTISGSTNPEKTMYKVYSNGYKEWTSCKAIKPTSSTEFNTDFIAPVIFESYMNKSCDVYRQGYSASTYYVLNAQVNPVSLNQITVAMVSTTTSNNNMLMSVEGKGY